MTEKWAERLHHLEFMHSEFGKIKTKRARHALLEKTGENVEPSVLLESWSEA